MQQNVTSCRNISFMNNYNIEGAEKNFPFLLFYPKMLRLSPAAFKYLSNKKSELVK